jgi:DNA (cytosine-5)-methyltransferase 1
MSTRKSKTIIAADLFCGAGGTSTGLRQACEAAGVKLNLIAVNHWDIAISTHTHNHPDADHLCTNLDSVDPRKVVPSGKLGLLVASPECTHHSIARGGKPINDQSRASAWRIVEWASQIRIENILIENVKEFRTWGPLGTNGRPLKRRKGETYFAFLNALRALGYTVEDRVLNAADYGDPTSRERLFIRARLGRKSILWPEPTHGPAAKAKPGNNGQLFETSHTRKPYRTAREIIDWTIPGESIFTRKRPLKPNTLNRIFKGLEKFSGIPFIVPNFGEREGQQPRTHSIDRPLPAVTGHGAGALIQPYLVKFFGGQHSQSVDAPLPTITANYEHYGLAQPFIVELRGGQDARSLDKPLSTITTKGMHHGIAEPYIVVLRNHADAQSVDDPLRTLTTGGNFGLAQPFILAMEHGGNIRSIDKPLNTITTAKGGAHGIVEPFLVKFHGDHQGRQDGQNRNHSLDDPLPTLDCSNRFGLAEPFIIPTNHGKDERSHDINRPMPTITSVDAWGLIEPYLVKYNGTGGAMPVNEPLDTVTAKDRFGLVEPHITEGQLALLDIRFRMLQPHELAAAMSFPRNYVFTGNREQKVKQIGNAVPVNLAKALCASILDGM